MENKGDVVVTVLRDEKEVVKAGRVGRGSRPSVRVLILIPRIGTLFRSKEDLQTCCDLQPRWVSIWRAFC